MTHLKRQKSPKSWPIERKGSVFVARPMQGMKKAIPLLIALRDMLNLAQNRKEVKKIIHSNKILLNNKIIKRDNEGLFLLDILKIVPSDEIYRLELNEKGKFDFIKIDKKEDNKKISKIINKKILKGKKIQLNLSDGRNFLSDIKCKTNDSLIINLNSNKVEKCIELKKDAKVIIFAGKHSGGRGFIENINSEKKLAEIRIGNKKVDVLIKQLMVIE